MPRHPRLFLTGLPMHIVQRGHDRQPVFRDTQDFMYYFDNLSEAGETYDVSIHAYCLMTNHVHLLVSPGEPPDGISWFMRLLAARQTRYANRKLKRTGTLWEGRFKASPIDSSAYMLACYRYIELNPVRAGIVGRPSDYRWSSYRHHVGSDLVDWLDTHSEYEALGTTPETRQATYRAFVSAAIDEPEHIRIRTAVNRNQVTGSALFRRRLAREVDRTLSAAAPGRPQKGKK